MGICIFSGSNEIEVLQIKEILEKNGIMTYLKNYHTQNILGATKMFTGMDLLAGDIELYVHERNVDKALEVLNNEIKIVDNEEIEQPEQQENIDNRLEKINTENIDYYEKSILGKAFILSFLSFFISPVFFNIGYLIHLFKNNRNIGIIFSIITIVSLGMGIFAILINIFIDYFNIYFGLLLVPILCTIKSISIYVRKKSLISLLYILIAIIFIVFIRLF
jgi:F0F1-type ATP synthase assembly protein I